eukprot:gene5139-biopygen12992
MSRGGCSGREHPPRDMASSETGPCYGEMDEYTRRRVGEAEECIEISFGRGAHHYKIVGVYGVGWRGLRRLCIETRVGDSFMLSEMAPFSGTISEACQSTKDGKLIKYTVMATYMRMKKSHGVNDLSEDVKGSGLLQRFSFDH